MKKIWLLSIVILFVTGCIQKESQKQSKLILVSKENSQKLYSKWLLHFDSTLQCVSLYHVSKDSIDYYLQKADGFLITGGTDINPARYGKENLKHECEEPDLFRDSMEFAMIDFAMKNNKPLFGICRGMQILNVANGGTLYTDIPTHLKSIDFHRKGSDSTQHWVRASEKNEIQFISQDSGYIVSHHHQAIENVAKGFSVLYKANDGVIEGIRASDTVKYSFIMGVQWHPERMDFSNKYSEMPAKEFLRRVNE